VPATAWLAVWQLTYKLCRAKSTSRPVMKLLREQKDFFREQLEGIQALTDAEAQVPSRVNEQVSMLACKGRLRHISEHTHLNTMTGSGAGKKWAAGSTLSRTPCASHPLTREGRREKGPMLLTAFSSPRSCFRIGIGIL